MAAIAVLACLTGCRRAPAAAPPAPARFGWEPIGPGGGGTITAPAVSPHNANLLFCACDMTGAYRSTDGGATWAMLDWEQLNLVAGYDHSSWAFSPADSSLVLVGCQAGVRLSRDAGQTWRSAGAAAGDRASVIEFDRARPLVVVALAAGSARLSRDAGATWQAVDPLPEPAGEPWGAVFDGTAPGRLIVGCEHGVFASDDGRGWQRCTTGIDADGQTIRDFEGASDGRRTVLWATVPTRAEGGMLAGGVYRSLDAGRTWRPAMGGLDTRLGARDDYSPDLPTYEHLAASDADTSVAYVSSVGTVILGDHPSTVYRTEDAGEHWAPVLFGDPRMPHHNVGPDWLRWSFGDTAWGLRASDHDPSVLLRSDLGRLQITRDGGQTWHHLHSPPPRREAVPNGTLTVTTSWHVAFDPFDPARLYLCDTDIGFWRSLDGGASWIQSTRGSPWSNTFYALACDRSRRGRLFAAVSNTHDIPYWKNVTRDSLSFHGGVVRSDDHGATWRPVGQRGGLPEAAVTDLQLDGATLWAAVMGHGVYTSEDLGDTWQPRNAGLGLERNENLLRVRRDLHGRLLALVTMRYYADRQDIRAGGLFASLDDGHTWRRLDDGATLWHPVEFAVDPRNADVIYVSCMEAPIGKSGGGLWKTTDGGATWHCVHRVGEGPSFAPAIDPTNPDTVYDATYGRGLWRSDDAGATWRRLALPFAAVHRVAFDPTEPRRIYVTTFGGGAWRYTEAP